jgi:hypothetical protein
MPCLYFPHPVAQQMEPNSVSVAAVDWQAVPIKAVSQLYVNKSPQVTAVERHFFTIKHSADI